MGKQEKMTGNERNAKRKRRKNGYEKAIEYGKKKARKTKTNSLQSIFPVIQSNFQHLQQIYVNVDDQETIMVLKHHRAQAKL